MYPVRAFDLSHPVIHLSSHGDVVHQLWRYVHRHLHLETLRGPATRRSEIPTEWGESLDEVLWLVVSMVDIYWMVNIVLIMANIVSYGHYIGWLITN